MRDCISIKVYTVLDDEVTALKTYKTNSDNKIIAHLQEQVKEEKMLLPKDFISYEPQKLNLKIFYTPWEDPKGVQVLTDSITVEELPAHVETKKINFPIFFICQNCETNFPTKYQYQRHQCDFNAENIVLKSSVFSDRLIIDREMIQMQRFECSICKKRFISQNNLDRHKTSHETLEENICEHCKKQFVTVNRLRIHKENHCKKAGDISKFYRSDVAVWKCKRCHEVFSSQEIGNYHTSICSEIVDLYAYDHSREDESDTTHLILNEEGIVVNKIKNHNESNCYVEKVLTELLLQCEFCNRTYADKNLLLMHQRKHTTDKNYECINCLRVFDSYVTASSHWLKKCSEFANLFYLPKLTFCEYCDRTFKSHELLYNHKVKKRHYTPKLHLGIGFDKENMHTEHQAIANLTEDILNKLDAAVEKTLGFGREQDQPENLTIQIKSEPTSDDDSSVSIALSDNRPNILKKQRSLNVKRYYPAIIDEGFKYQCQMCIKVFNSVIALENHRATEHSANFRCDDCGQNLQTIKALLIHSRAHKSLKPYVCDTCGRSYSQTSHLWQHMRFHQGIKPFACPHEGCEARYTIRPDLKDHIRKVHTRERPFKCNVCNKCFLTGSVYYQHRLIHTNDRRYGCDICQKRFFRADALNNHRRIHTDERPYPCVICGREFRQKGDRNKHMRTQHAK